jgi:GNAT superfamily N-acetyltransferase
MAGQFSRVRELRDFVDLEMARRLEAAETMSNEHVAALRRYFPDAISEVIGGGAAVFASVGYPANHIVGMGLYGPISENDIDCVEHFYRSRSVPCEIVVSPLADRSLTKLLGERGYRVTEFNSVLIRRLEDCKPFEPADGLRIERVTRANESVWNETILRGFAEYGALPTDLFLPFATLAESLNFLAWLDGVPAGGGMGQIMHGAGIAALFGSATVPEYRGRGVQTALIQRRLWEALQAGCEYAVVSTLPGSGSQRNMERRGFRVAYTKIVLVRTWPELERDDGHREHS